MRLKLKLKRNEMNQRIQQVCRKFRINKKIRVLFVKLPKNVLGTYRPTKKGFDILCTKTTNFDRAFFTIIHELAHVKLHNHQCQNDDQYSGHCVHWYALFVEMCVYAKRKWYLDQRIGSI